MEGTPGLTTIPAQFPLRFRNRYAGVLKKTNKILQKLYFHDELIEATLQNLPNIF